MTLISPTSGKKLVVSGDGTKVYTLDRDESFPIESNVIKFLSSKDDFYEGTYLNRIKFNPKKDNYLNSLFLWIVNGGFLYRVRKTFHPGSVLLELGCASGIDYFGSRYAMVGLDLSFQSLKGISNYKLRLQADATKIPLENSSVDGIISSYFWEHIPPSVKEQMLKEFSRVLKPGGQLVFLYDVETSNSLICKLKHSDEPLYNRLFLEGDGHLGYQTPTANMLIFEDNGFHVKRNFGMEKTWFQSASVWAKFRLLNGGLGSLGRLMFWATRSKLFGYLYMLLIRIVDESIGKFFPLSQSRIILTIAKRK